MEDLDSKMREYQEKVRRMTDVPKPDKNALVPVRAHFRRQPNFCNKRPDLLKAIRQFWGF